MPYFKKSIGSTPVYVQQHKTFFFGPNSCPIIYQKLLQMNIPVVYRPETFGCALSILDIHENYITQK
jgi:hypothetical protein